MSSTLTTLLRPALEAAVATARAGERSTPPVPSPAVLKRFLSFARLPDPALELGRRVLDEDEAFRARVAASTTEADVGRAGWLFLTRPEGWRNELEDLRRQVAAERSIAREERAERDAQRRLAGAEAALLRTEATARAAAEEAERLRVELGETRTMATALSTEVERLQAELATAVEGRAAAVRALKAAEATAQQRGSELRALRHELRMTQAELTGGAAVAPAAPPAAEAPPAPEVEVEGSEVAGAGGAGEPAPAQVPVPVPAEPSLDRAALAAAVEAAAGAARQLSAALASASSLLAGPQAPSAAAAAPPTRPAPADGAVSGNRREPRRHARPRRRPLPLPPAVLDDTPEAAAHLVRAPGALVLVDGYNVSNLPWRDLPPAEQRSRLLDACAELHARVGTEVEVVFDGTGDAPTGRALLRADVRYRFTPAGVEADDELLARVDDEPPDRPVVVVSSDRRVLDGARARGANVVVSPAFVATLRR